MKSCARPKGIYSLPHEARYKLAVKLFLDALPLSHRSQLFQMHLLVIKRIVPDPSSIFVLGKKGGVWEGHVTIMTNHDF